MTTLMQTLDSESLETLRDISVSTYLDGECYAFATALSQGLGWPIVGLMDGAVVRHVAVRAPDGRLLDVRGFVLEKDFGEPFGFAPPHTLREVTTAELVRTSEPEQARLHSVALARKLAEAMWPGLPWIDSSAKRIVSFCDELEALCRKHRVWIRSPYPAAKPILAKGEDDEGGYEICPTADGVSFTIDRYFP